ncbi:Golgi-associated PDZ and coiled-coil motif-containing protein-like [Acanthaster planci]|uniref:Golgi-associated PDZ and coiled-coil motif-containing protein n=1 Tax=Acanthaster planci TaxID=133434 RepID=A0A8B7Z473_ACAPL|nr:Golgi-associated PDZ and coiled-coil motif-containing protein-like [Acanthaster planci]XP_022100429.1 Golgi-associated PDZ and coiled-coil motif-containing protein-like [Acanthaster planci]
MSAKKMAAIHWLDILEKEFDKAFVDLDILLGEVDPDQCEITYEGRRKMTALSAAFAQLCHKAQTIFQNNAKLEAQVMNLRADLCEVRATKSIMEKELHNQLLQLHAVQLQLHAKTGQNVDSDAIKKRLEQEMESFKADGMKEARMEAELKEYQKENVELRQHIMALQGEVYGARLAAKYLDKELAGRIQQIQLLGRDLRGPEHDKLWNQLEAEIHLHRHKTVIRACRGRQGYRNRLPQPPGHDDAISHRGVGETRTVLIVKEESEGLGMSITGGKEHGVPILISEIHEGLPADRSQGLYVGDAILSVNGINLRDAKHAEAVEILSRQNGEISMEVQFVAPDSDSDDDNDEIIDENGYSYPVYEESEEDLLSYQQASEDSPLRSQATSQSATPLHENSPSTSSAPPGRAASHHSPAKKAGKATGPKTPAGASGGGGLRKSSPQEASISTSSQSSERSSAASLLQGDLGMPVLPETGNEMKMMSVGRMSTNVVQGLPSAASGEELFGAN